MESISDSTVPTKDAYGLSLHFEVSDRAFSYHRRLGKVRDFVNQNYMGPISLEKVARIACNDPAHFSRFFHQKTGVRFRDWLAAIRLHHAIRLLGETNYSHAEVAKKVGFGSRRSLDRAAMKLTGETTTLIKKRVLFEVS